MNYLLDTNICVYWLKGNKLVEKNALKRGLDNLSISFITQSELYYGAYKSQRVEKNMETIKQLESRLGKINSSSNIRETFGKLKASLAREGKIIDDADIFIACCALENDCVLIANNEKHFARIAGL
ncbi:MAG: type II toxin-antitoxin system VapC family toxin [bacterium]|nr:type II toxin-antitoxin system VapC family toxin [bacterium]